MELDLDAALSAFALDVADPSGHAESEIVVLDSDEENNTASRDVSGPSEAAAHGNDAHEEGEQIDGLAALALVVEEPGPKRPRFDQRSPACIAHARMHRSVQVAQKRAAEAGAREQEAIRVVDTVCAVLPAAAKLIGKPTQGAIGRTKTSSPVDFICLVRALHLPATTQVRLGVKLRRLICLGAKLIEMRQNVGLACLLRNSRLALEHVAGPSRHVHIMHMQMWDEVQTKFRFRASTTARENSLATEVRTVVQRGAVVCTLMDKLRNQLATYGEYWLARPLEVSDTRAGSLLPAIEKGSPAALLFSDTHAIQEVARSVSSFTYMPMSDRAGSNVSIMKHWGAKWEAELLKLREHEGTGRLLYWPDTCSIHLHHRAKVQLKGLQHHLVRHFSIANLHRQQHIQTGITKRLENLVFTSEIKRVTQPAPQSNLTLTVVADILFDFNAPHHDRKNGGQAQKKTDLLALCELVNCDLTGNFTHYCWNSSTGRPCCRNPADMKEKLVVALSHALFGEADPVPAESRWTHLLSNFKKTLLRKLVFGFGIKAFPNVTTPEDTKPAEGIKAALDEYFKKLQGQRVANTADYYQNDMNMFQLAVYTMALECCDSLLLYPLLGDTLRLKPEEPPKLQKLLDKDNSALGRCLQGLLGLLESWATEGSTDALRTLLSVLGAPTQEPGFMRWARNQLLRLSAALFRRYEVRLSAWPFRLFELVRDDSPEAGKVAVANALLEAPRDMLDVYSLGVRTYFNSVEALLSVECRTILTSDFNSHAYGTDLVERLNAELTSRHPRRAPARAMANAARESLLRQAVVVHRSRGGQDPLAPKSFSKDFDTETAACMPLLPLADTADATGGAGPSDSRPGSEFSGHSAHDGSDALVPTGPCFEQAVSVVRQNSARLVPQKTTNTTDAPALRTGLNPYMLELNKYMQAAKRAKGSTLTPEEVDQTRADFKTKWSAMEGHDTHDELYQDWRTSGKSSQQRPQELVYQPTWGGGSVATPITKEEMCKFVQKHSWPTDLELADKDKSETRVPPNETIDFEATKNYNLWGVGQWARNIQRESASDKRLFELVEKGVHNFLVHLGKDEADSGGVLLIVEGPAKAADKAKWRVPFFVTGTSYSPKVFDITMLEFGRPDDKFEDELALPCDLKVATRPCRVSSGFRVLANLTSDELIAELKQDMSSMGLHVASYEPICPDGTLLWSRVHKVDFVGTLYEPNMKQPLNFGRDPSETSKEHRARQTILRSMLVDDPFGSAAQQRAIAKARAAGKNIGFQPPRRAERAEPGKWDSRWEQHGCCRRGFGRPASVGRLAGRGHAGGCRRDARHCGKRGRVVRTRPVG